MTQSARLDAARLVAIDTHVHLESESAGHTATDAAARKYFSVQAKVTRHVVTRSTIFPLRTVGHAGSRPTVVVISQRRSVSQAITHCSQCRTKGFRKYG